LAHYLFSRGNMAQLVTLSGNYGVSHDTESMSGVGDALGYLYRPSKVRKWAGVGSATCTGAGAVTAVIPGVNFASPLLFACGAVLGAGQAVSNSVYAEGRRRKAIRDNKVYVAKKNKNTLYLALGAVAVVGLVATL